jgi:hypothetical protein
MHSQSTGAIDADDVRFWMDLKKTPGLEDVQFEIAVDDLQLDNIVITDAEEIHDIANRQLALRAA